MGRLIDEDAVKRRMHETMDYQDLYLPVHFEMCMNDAPTVEPASPWHRVEEPPKDACDCLVCWTTIRDEETGEVTGHGFWCEKGWYEDRLLGGVGFYCQRREETHPVRVEPDYWMPIEPPKEDEHGN